MGRLLMICSIVLTLTTAAWADEPFDFKGVPFGASEQDLLQKHPDFKCQKGPPLTGDRACLLTQKRGASYAGVGATVMVSFFSDKITHVTINFNSSEFDVVKGALIIKYGAPTTESSTSVSNRMGATFQNQQGTWDKNDGLILEINKYAGEISKSSVHIYTKEDYEKFKGRKITDSKSRAGDL